VDAWQLLVGGRRRGGLRGAVARACGGTMAVWMAFGGREKIYRISVKRYIELCRSDKR
jgi:hypothetical protein